MTECEIPTGTRVSLVTNDEDHGRVGTVRAPDGSPFASMSPELLASLGDISRITGKPGHVIVLLDGESGQVAHGGRGGKAVCVPIDQVAVLDAG